MNTILIIDGNALLHRAYHAIPDFTTKEGLHTNAVYGFITMLDRAIINFKPYGVVVCFDHKEKTKRKEMFEHYKAQRPKTDDNLISQFPLAREFLIASGICFFEKAGYEADDLIGIIAHHASDHDCQSLIFSGDRDLMQLVSDKIFMVTPGKTAEEMKWYGVDEVKAKFGVDPTLIPDLKSLTGDASDNYKGIDGIGPKTASNLINQFGSLENIYENLEKVENEKTRKLLEDFKHDAVMAKKLSTIMYDAEIDIDLEKTHFVKYNEELKPFLEKYQFKSLLSRLFRPKTEIKIEEKKPETQQIGLF